MVPPHAQRLTPVDRPARRPAWAPLLRRAAAPGLATVLALTPVLGSAAAGSPTTLVPAATASVPGAAPAVTPVHDELQLLLDDVDPTVAVVGEDVTLRGRIVNGTGTGQRLGRVGVHAA